MSVIDRVESAKHIIAGSPIGKAIAKATSREIIGPKKKHVDYLLQSINFENVNIPNMVDMLFERTQISSWIVTFKGLIVFHHLMSAGNERFIQCLASRSSTWMLQAFLDKGGVQGYDMSHAIRRYSHYLSEKSFIYRTMGYDFCRIPRGKENGVLRNMETSKLLKALPEIQRQLDALLSTEFTGNDLTNGVITAAFMLLFKDLIRLFAGYNDGIINLLEKYFDMKKPDCKASLDIYKKFVNRMERVSAFLRVAEDVGIDKGDIPDLTQAPSSLLAALENHMQSLEKGKTFTPPSKPVTLPSFTVSASADKSFNPFGKDTFEATDGGSNEVLEQERKALEEFQRRKQAQDAQQNQPVTQTPPPAIVPPANQPRTNRQPQPTVQPQKELLLNQAAQAPLPQASGANDLLQLNSNLFGDNFQTNMTRSSTFPLDDQRQADAWSNQNASWGQQNASTVNPFNTTNNNTAFAPTFQADGGQNGDVLLGDLLTPVPLNGQPPVQPTQSLDENKPKDLSSSLARVAQSLDDLAINPNMQRAQTQKGKHQWKPQQPQVKTGGAHYQGMSVAKNTFPNSSPQPGWGATNPSMGMQSFPGQAPTGMYPQYGNQPGMMQSGIGMFPMQNSVPRMNAPVTSQDPFGPVPGSQVEEVGLPPLPFIEANVSVNPSLSCSILKKGKGSFLVTLACAKKWNFCPGQYIK